MSNNTVTVNEIRAALARDPRIPHPAEIAVSEREGIVTLRGDVDGLKQRRAAVLISKSVPGVRGVEDELRSDPRDRFQDGEIRGAALQALKSNDEVPAERVEVTVADGWLSLKGEVQHQHESDAAFRAVSEVPGVGGITNRIVVITAGIDG